MNQISDVIRQNINIVDYARSIGLTPIHKPSWAGDAYTLKEHGSVRIDATQNVFYRNSTGAHGGIIDFCMEFEHRSQKSAIQHLRGVLDDPTYHTAAQARVEPKTPKEAAPKSIELPDRSTQSYKRLYAYLVKTRCLNSDLVQQLVDRKLLYQDNRGNAVFCGADYDSEIKYASYRTTATDVQYRGEASGSSKQVGFSFNLVGCNPSRLFVAESPIDCLSLASMMKQYSDVPLSECAFLSLGGIAPAALLYHLPKHSSVDRIYLCHDNDTAGNAARSKTRQLLEGQNFQGKIIDKSPKGKDFNDDLRALTQATQQTQHQNQTIQERGLNYEIV